MLLPFDFFVLQLLKKAPPEAVSFFYAFEGVHIFQEKTQSQFFDRFEKKSNGILRASSQAN